MHDFEKESRLINTSDQSSLQTGACVASTPSVADLEHPWLGLESFQEETRAYFFGRDAEIDELHLRLCNLPLLVLYGRSGLGKTSILKAGLIPRLREENQLPLLLRLRYGDTASDPCNQLVSVVFGERKDGQAEAISLGQALEWVRCLGEKLKLSLPEDLYSLLWLRLHYRDELPAITHLIIDQFEEVFTLGAQYPDVENCVRDILAILLQRVIPQPISKLILEHDKFLDYFDPDSIPVRVLLALRDDYVYALNRWRRHLPALSQNNFELRALRGSAAFDAVYRPGTLRCHYQGKISEENKIETGLLPIISEETAEKIVCFFAKKSDDVPLEEIEADSSLLSLLCRELNGRRFNQSPCAEQIQFDGKDDIDEIIVGFYDRCLAQRPEAVRTFIEEEFISAKGARLAQDEASILDAFENGYKHRNDNWFVQGYGNGNAIDARTCLNDLVSRRLLSPLAGDKPRYELTHDLLAKVVEKKRTEARERHQWIKQNQESQKEEFPKIRTNIIKVNLIALTAFIVILLLWQNAEKRADQWRDKSYERVNEIESCEDDLKIRLDDCDKKYKSKDRDEDLKECRSQKKEEFLTCTRNSTQRKVITADAQALVDLKLLGIKLEVRYPAAILSLLVLGLLMYLRRARNEVLRSSTKIVKTLQQLDQPTEGVLYKALGKIWWLAPLPNQDGNEVKARDLERALKWQDCSLRNTIFVIIASILMIFMVCYFFNLGLITKEFFLLKEFWGGINEFWKSAIWPVVLLFCVFWSLFQIYAWWRQRRVPEFKDGQIQDGLSRREFFIAFSITCMLVTFSILKARKILGNPRYRMNKPKRSAPEPTLPVGAFRKNVNSGIFHGILPSKPAKRLARKIIPVVHCLPLKPEALEPIEDIAILRSITFTSADGKDGKREPHVQLSRSACAFEQAALARIVSNDIEGACQLLLVGVRHDLLYSSRMRRRSSVHLYDLLAGLAVRHDMPQHLKSLDSLIKEQKDQMSAIHKRQKIWEDTTSNWHKRWANKSKSLKWSGLPM